MKNMQSIAEAYAQGRIDAGEPAFMDPDGFTSAATVGAFGYHYGEAGKHGHELNLTTAWAVFMETAGRTVVHTDTDTPEDEMATVAEVEAMRAALASGLCLNSRTFMGGGTYRCSLRVGHDPRMKHTYTLDGQLIQWEDDESDQELAKRIHFVPASTYSTKVTTTGYPVSTDAQASVELPVEQEV